MSELGGNKLWIVVLFIIVSANCFGMGTYDLRRGDLVGWAIGGACGLICLAGAVCMWTVDHSQKR